MTYREILAAIEGNQRKVKSELQLHSMLMYRLGSLVGYAVNDPKNYPSYQKAFPFGEKSEQQGWRRMKANIETYAAEWRRRGEIKNGDNN